MIDNTIIDDQTTDPEEIEVSETKDIDQYVNDYLKDSDNKQMLTDLFASIKQEAEEKMKEIE